MGPGESFDVRPADGHLNRDHFAFPNERTMPLEVLLAPLGALQASIPTTLILGRDDDLHPPDPQAWAARTFPDVRIVDCDHFVPVRAPEVIAGVVIEAFSAS